MKNNKNYSSLQLTVKIPKGRSIDHTIRMKKGHYRQYFNAQHIYFQLSNVERSFFEYLLENTDSSSRVFVDTNLKKGYISFLKKIMGGLPDTVTPLKIESAVRKICKLHLILPVVDIRGLYYINPKYAHVGTETSRLNLFDKILTERQMNNLPINMLLDVPDDQLDAK